MLQQHLVVRDSTIPIPHRISYLKPSLYYGWLYYHRFPRAMLDEWIWEIISIQPTPRISYLKPYPYSGDCLTRSLFPPSNAVWMDVRDSTVQPTARFSYLKPSPYSGWLSYSWFPRAMSGEGTWKMDNMAGPSRHKSYSSFWVPLRMIVLSLVSPKGCWMSDW